MTVSSAGKELILPEHLRPGAVVCDVARPRDVSVRVSKERPDVLAIEGGVVRVPGEVDFNFDFGFEEGTAYACMSETMLLALEDDPSLFNFTLGKEVSVEQVDRINALAKKHGFGLAGFRAFERPVTQAGDRACSPGEGTRRHDPEARGDLGRPRQGTLNARYSSAPNLAKTTHSRVVSGWAAIHSRAVSIAAGAACSRG